MMEKRRVKDGIGRRRFIIGAGAFLVTGTIAAINACIPSSKREEVQAAGILVHDPSKCVGCGVCGLMCSLYHEGEQGNSLSRSELVRDPFTYEFTLNVCQQCPSPSCYFACPLKDIARCIDEVTGARYVDEEECSGCGKCVTACPLEPVRVKLHTEKNIAFNCDLCMGRDDGPICVEYCTANALTYVPKEERGGNGV